MLPSLSLALTAGQSFGFVEFDGFRANPDALGGGDLVAHEGQQRRDQKRATGAPVPQEPGCDEVHEALAPTRALHHQQPFPVFDQ